MANNFDELEKTLTALLEGASPQSRFKALRIIARRLKAQNQRRIAAQKEPSGQSFTPRRKRPYFQPETAAKFLYPEHGTGKARFVHLKSWTLTDDTITGADEKSGGAVKSFKKSKIIAWLPSNEPAGGVTSQMRARLEKNSTKNKMFAKLLTNKYIKAKNDDSSLEIGFYGSAGKIAAEHHYGATSTIKTRAQSKTVKMPRRELLGINEADETIIYDELLKILDWA